VHRLHVDDDEDKYGRVEVLRGRASTFTTTHAVNLLAGWLAVDATQPVVHLLKVKPALLAALLLLLPTAAGKMSYLSHGGHSASNAPGHCRPTYTAVVYNSNVPRISQ